MNYALLLSGGIGSRLSPDIPKQYIRVSGKMLITYALDILICSSQIDEIQIVAEDGWKELILADCRDHGINTDKIRNFAMPGPNRQTSILNGLQNILRQDNGKAEGENAKCCDTVLVHDAARPLITDQQVYACFEKLLEGHDGVMPVLPMKDTIYLSSNGSAVTGLLDRQKIFAGQAPELFRLKKYYCANVALTPDDLRLINGSAEPAVMAGMDIAMIPGDENNFKITTRSDLERFIQMIKRNGD